MPPPFLQVNPELHTNASGGQSRDSFWTQPFVFDIPEERNNEVGFRREMAPISRNRKLLRCLLFRFAAPPPLVYLFSRQFLGSGRFIFL